MAFTDERVTVRQVDAGVWELVEPLEYHGNTHRFVIEAGFLTDFATVPRLVSWLIPRYGVYTPCAILHDYLCELGHVGMFNRRDADGIFRRSLRELGVSGPRRYLMWTGVRAGGLMRGATRGEWLLFALLAPVALAFIAVPAVLVQLWLIVFWLLELVWWLFSTRPTASAPPLELSSD